MSPPARAATNAVITHATRFIQQSRPRKRAVFAFIPEKQSNPGDASPGLRVLVALGVQNP
jgi:hypothetical protein